jgi:hypothetical protein
MNTRFSSAIVALFCAATLFAKDAATPDIYIFNVGPKNPTYNEAKFPHLTFLYSPELKGQGPESGAGKAAVGLAGMVGGGEAHEMVKGEPQIIEKFWNGASVSVSFGGKTTSAFKALLFDKNGVCAWQGCVDPDDIEESEGEGIDDNLGDALEKLLAKGKTTEVSADPLNPEDNEGIYGRKLTEFNVTTAAGESKAISAVVAAGKTTLLIFTRIPETIDMKDPEAAAKNAKSAGDFWMSQLVAAYKNTTESFFKDIEKEIFNTKIKD